MQGRFRGSLQVTTAASASRLGGIDVVSLLVFYVIVLALFAFLPTMFDLWKSYKKLPPGQAPQGMQGLTRGLIALTTILILGIVLLHLSIFGSPSSDITPTLNNLLSLLGGLLAAITGFYFGSRSGQQATDAALEVAKASVGARAPSLAPTDAKATIKGHDVTVQWTAPVSPVGVNLVGYSVKETASGKISTATAIESHATFPGLNAGTYTFTVTAAYSDSTSATSAPTDPVTVP
jgi:fibronectin type III domain protein